MTALLPQIERESIMMICLMAAFADGGESEVEREELKRIAENFPGADVNLAALYQCVLLRQVSAAQAAQPLASPETRQLAYEMTVCVREADDMLNEPERQLLAGPGCGANCDLTPPRPSALSNKPAHWPQRSACSSCSI